MRIAVLSDLHAYSVKQTNPPSHLYVGDGGAQPSRNPLAGLKQLIANESLRADMLICPGDLTDKADPTALNYVWGELHTLGKLLGATSLIATAGNHDVDSRHQHNDFDARGALQTLSPSFPGLSEELCDRYWARNFVLIEETGWRVLLVNSSAYHGGGKDVDREARHGRISERTTEAIGRALAQSQKRPINVVVCHHHLYRDNAIHEADYSEMEGADHLLRLLGSGDHGQWLVVHGHKHHPKLQYGLGSLMSPIVFGAGSLSATLYADLAAQARNQFYLLELDPLAAAKLRLDLAGKLRAWDWIPHSGWQAAGLASGLPHQSGFGFRATVTSIAVEIAKVVHSHPPFARWTEVVTQVPSLDYLTPGDISAVVQTLSADHNIAATRDSLGAVLELAKR